MIPLALVTATFGLFQAPGAAHEQRLGDARCHVEIDQTTVSLSGTLRLSLTIEGGAPIDVELPRPLTVSPDWHIRADEPPVIRDLASSRQSWSQRFTVEPFQIGDAIALQLAPVRFRVADAVRDQELKWPAFHIRVTSTLREFDVGASRPITSIEPASLRPQSTVIQYAGLCVAFASLAVVAIVLMRVRRRRPHSANALASVLRAIDDLERQGATTALMPRVADLVREYLEIRLNIAITKLTTAEVVAALSKESDLGRSYLESLEDLLTQIDLVKFAGRQLMPSECSALVGVARELLMTDIPKKPIK